MLGHSTSQEWEKNQFIENIKFLNSIYVSRYKCYKSHINIMLSKRKKIEPKLWFHLQEDQKQAKFIFYIGSQNNFCH